MQIKQISKAFGSQDLLRRISYAVPKGERIALVGANGAGKTTLLNIICGLEPADEGLVQLDKNETLGYLPQIPDANPAATLVDEVMRGADVLMQLKAQMDAQIAEMAAQASADGQAAAAHIYEELEAQFRRLDGYSLESRAGQILHGLGFSQSQLRESPLSLSGGWRMRLELAKLLVRAPDVLVLDEPTNHLDLPSLIWVENYLNNFRGTLIFVSHDRKLLNRIATVTLHLHNATLEAYPGNFDKFLDLREARLEQDAATRDKLRQRREHMERFVERFRAKASKATQAQSRIKMIDRLRDLEADFSEEEGAKSMSLRIPPPRRDTGRIVLDLNAGSIGYATPLCTGINLQIEKGHKIAVIGANGVGKSTLLRSIKGDIPLLSGTLELSAKADLGFFAQEQKRVFDPKLDLLETVLDRTKVGQSEARSVLGALLFSNDTVKKQVGALSGGELSRLGLACLLSERANLLLLDEPTNHLDMTSVEVLVSALDEFEGTVLFVSHDREFIDGICTHIFVITGDGRSQLFEGKLSDYERMAEAAGFPNVLGRHLDGGKETSRAADKTQERPAPVQVDYKDVKRRLQKAEKQLGVSEGRIQQLQKVASDTEAALASVAADDYRKAEDLHRELVSCQEQIEEAEHEWLLASEEIEACKTELEQQGRLYK